MTGDGCRDRMGRMATTSYAGETCTISHLETHLAGRQWFVASGAIILAHLGAWPPVAACSVGITLSQVWKNSAYLKYHSSDSQWFPIQSALPLMGTDAMWKSSQLIYNHLILTSYFNMLTQVSQLRYKCFQFCFTSLNFKTVCLYLPNIAQAIETTTLEKRAIRHQWVQCDTLRVLACIDDWVW